MSFSILVCSGYRPGSGVLGYMVVFRASQVALVINPPATAGKPKRHRFDPWVRKIPWRRAWQPTPGFLPGESQGRGSLAGCSPNGSDMTERVSTTQLGDLTSTQQEFWKENWKEENHLRNSGTEITEIWEFPGSPVFKIPCFHCRGPGFNRWLGN